MHIQNITSKNNYSHTHKQSIKSIWIGDYFPGIYVLHSRGNWAGDSERFTLLLGSKALKYLTSNFSHPEVRWQAGKWVYRNLIKFNKGICKVLHPGKNNLLHRYMLGPTQLESSLAEKDQQSVVAARKSNGILSCIRQSTVSRIREVIFSL